MSEVYKCGPASYATADGRFVISRRNHALLAVAGRQGSRVTWVVTETTGTRPFRDSSGEPVAECWVGSLAAAKAAVREAS